MHTEKKPRCQLVMVCPQCGELFQPEVFGLHVRLCPICEAKKAAFQKDLVSNIDRLPSKGDQVKRFMCGRG
jgi:hypothetical protein